VAYTRNFLDPTATGDHLAVIDAATKAINATIDTPFGIYYMVAAPDMSRLYLADQNDALVVIDLQSNAAIGSIKGNYLLDRLTL